MSDSNKSKDKSPKASKAPKVIKKSIDIPSTDQGREGLDPYSGSYLVDYARGNSRLAAVAAVSSTLVLLMAVLFSSYISKNRNHVAAIPVGENWEMPAVHWINVPHRYEQAAKPIHVAMKYVRGIYEIDPLDFSENLVDQKRVMLSDRISELLAYVIPGTEEYLKVNQALEKSHSAFKMYSDCNCVKRFLVSDVMTDYSPLPVLRIELVGRYVIFGTDGRSPLPAEDLGYKSVTLYLGKDIPLAEQNKDGSINAVNPEGYYIVRSTIKTISPDELKVIRKIRKAVGMKGAL